MKNLLIILLICGTIMLSGCNSITGNVIQNTNESCKIVHVQRQAIKTYQEPLKYEDSGTNTTTMHGNDVWAVGEVTIKNVDTDAGSFTVAQTFMMDGKSVTKTTTQDLKPGESKLFHEEYMLSGTDFTTTYTVQPSTKTATETITYYSRECQ